MTIIFAEIDTHFNHEKVSFVAVGDNLIHPVVYNDAKLITMTMIFHQCIKR